jgi:hypothetical protein
VPLSTKTLREMQEGARQLGIHARADGLRRMARNKERENASGKNLRVLARQELPRDPAIKLPADVQATIAGGEAAFKRQRAYKPPRGPSRSGQIPTVITSVVDQDVQDHRDANLDARERPTKRRRRQPPMTNRLRAVMIVVDRLMADGVPFGVGPNSKMNKAICKWLNERAKRSSDHRPSRRKEITPTAVRALLKQVRAEGQLVTQRKPCRRQTTQEIARELLRQLRERRAPGID